MVQSASLPRHPAPARGIRGLTAGLIPALAALCLMAAPVRSDEPTMVTAPYEGTFKPGQALIVDIPFDTSSVLNGGYPIDNNGYAQLPLVGRIQVSGKNVADVEAYLAARASNYLKDTHISVHPAIRLTFLGYWVKPGMFYAEPNELVWDVIKRAGGPAGEKNMDKWSVVRGGEKVDIKVASAFSKGQTLSGAGVQSGDIFVIPVPDGQGFWYWFTQSLTVTSQIATLLTGILSAYITYLVYQDTHNN
jgi:protein involved in polysaccharide export with SLBB domain